MPPRQRTAPGIGGIGTWLIAGFAAAPTHTKFGFGWTLIPALGGAGTALSARHAGAQTDPRPGGGQSILHPASPDAQAITDLFWVMTGAGALIWALVMGVTIFAVLSRRKPKSDWFADRFILGAGVVFPTVALAALLIFGLRLLPDWREGDRPDLRVHVVGEQFWWRVTYERPDGGRFETANSLHLPVGAEVELVLTAHDVIHSFWIPALGGKLDMIPGRETVLRLRPAEIGRYRGVCAEFCGLSHALMAFEAVVEPQESFDAWVEAEAAPAAVTEAPAAYFEAGCDACHVIRGLPGGTAVGPDLTHFASRPDMGAGTLPLDRATVMAWLTEPEALKPGANMPSYAHLPEADRAEITDFLLRLK